MEVEHGPSPEDINFKMKSTNDISIKPKGKMPDWMQWEPMMNQKTGQVIGIKDSEGKFYRFNKNENFSMDKIAGSNERTVFITKKDGQKIPFTEWVQKEEEQSKEKELKINKEILNNITNKCSVKGACFGREVNLRNDEIEQLEIVDTLSETLIDKYKKNNEWKEFESKKNELSKKGIMGGFKGFPPSWLIKGDELTEHVELKGSSITVPQNIYNTYYWTETIKQFHEEINDAKKTNPLDQNRRKNYGRNTRELSKYLKDLAHLLKSHKVI